MQLIHTTYSQHIIFRKLVNVTATTTRTDGSVTSAAQDSGTSRTASSASVTVMHTRVIPILESVLTARIIQPESKHFTILFYRVKGEVNLLEPSFYFSERGGGILYPILIEWDIIKNICNYIPRFVIMYNFYLLHLQTFY